MPVSEARVGTSRTGLQVINGADPSRNEGLTLASRTSSGQEELPSHEPGSYVLRGVANDGELTDQKDVGVQVNAPSSSF